MIQPLNTLLGLGLIVALGACAGKSSIKADNIRALPEVSMDQAMNAFRQVCINNGSDPTGGKVMFAQGKTPGGRQACTMRARPEAGVDVLQDLQSRFGKTQQVPDTILIQFPGYPNGPLTYVGGKDGTAEEGTYQVGVTS